MDQLPPDAHRLCVAPMMEWTDRHCRTLHRLLAPHARLYTEMVTTGALVHGPRERLLAFGAEGHPVALQLGGADPDELADVRAPRRGGGLRRDQSEPRLPIRPRPGGTIVVSTAQPSKRLVKTLLDKNTPMDDGFIKEQIRRQDQRRDTQFYDVTGWSLPLLYGVEC